MNGQKPIEEVKQWAQGLLDSQQTTTIVDDIDGDIRAHHSSTNFIATLSLIPQVIALIPIIGLLLQVGCLLGAHLVPGILRLLMRHPRARWGCRVALCLLEWYLFRDPR